MTSCTGANRHEPRAFHLHELSIYMSQELPTTSFVQTRSLHWSHFEIFKVCKRLLERVEGHAVNASLCRATASSIQRPELLDAFLVLSPPTKVDCALLLCGQNDVLPSLSFFRDDTSDSSCRGKQAHRWTKTVSKPKWRNSGCRFMHPQRR